MEHTINQPHVLDGSFVNHLNQAITKLWQTNHFGQASRVESARNSFANFLRSQGMADVSLREFTAPLVGAYQQWLIEGGVKRNSTSCYMRTLQSVYNKVTAGTDTPSEQPFARVYRGIGKTRKRATSISAMQALQSLDIRRGLLALGKAPKGKVLARLERRLAFARDLFVFSYCSRGMAFVDAAYLKKEDIRYGTIHYRRRKTGQAIEVALEPIMQGIIDRYARQAVASPYVFPILPVASDEATYRAYRTALRSYNKHLGILAQILGGGVVLTSYVARHSWASNMHEMNMPLSVISQGLGHDSELTTQIYIKSLENHVVHAANRTFINWIFPPS